MINRERIQIEASILSADYSRLGEQALEAEAAAIAQAGLFDEAYYKRQYKDMRTAANPLLSYCESGWRQGRNPSEEFHTGYYLEKNPDIRAGNLNPLWHFSVYGAAEGRGAVPARCHGVGTEAVGELGEGRGLDQVRGGDPPLDGPPGAGGGGDGDEQGDREERRQGADQGAPSPGDRCRRAGGGRRCHAGVDRRRRAAQRAVGAEAVLDEDLAGPGEADGQDQDHHRQQDLDQGETASVVVQLALRQVPVLREYRVGRPVARTTEIARQRLQDASGSAEVR